MNRQANRPLRPVLVTLVFVALLAWSGSVRAQEIELVGHLDPLPGALYADVWGAGDYAYLGTQDNGVFIIDIADPTGPQLAHHYLPGENFQDVKVVGNTGYFASQFGLGVHIVDLTDPSNPSLLKQVTSADGGLDFIHNISVFGDFLYEASGFDRDVKVLDISTPSDPVYVQDIRVGLANAVAHDITALGDRLYTSDLGGRTRIFDVSKMSVDTPPTLLAQLNTGSATHSNWVNDEGNLLATARECGGINCGVALFDISDPANAVLLKNILDDDFGFSASTPHNPIIVGDILYVSWYEAGLQVFDISDPANPVRIGEYDTYDGDKFGLQGNWGVYPLLGEQRVLLSDRTNGLFIVDVSKVVPEPGSWAIALMGLLLLNGGRSFRAGSQPRRHGGHGVCFLRQTKSPNHANADLAS